MKAFRPLVLCAVLNAALMPPLVQAQDWSPMPAPQSSSGGKGWFLALLLPKVGEVLIQSISQSASCVFARLFSKLGTGVNAESPACNGGQLGPNYMHNGAGFHTGYAPSGNPGQHNAWQGQGYGAGPMPGQQSAYGQAPAPAPVGTMQTAAPMLSGSAASLLSSQPVLSFLVQKLANEQPRAAVVDVLAQDQQLTGSNEPGFVIRTGEAFAIRFSTSVPGRVRLINTDVDNVVTPSSLYEAIPGSDNRMPREHEGGILMTGKPGQEYLDVEFVPCISTALSGHPAVQPFAASLPPCSQAGATRQYAPTAVSPGVPTPLGDAGGKAMQFPATPDPTQPVAVAPEGYSKGEPLRFRVRIAHVAP